MTLRLETRPSGIILPVLDLGLRDLPSRDLILGDDIAPVLAILTALGPREQKLLRTDAAGNLLVSGGGLGGAVKLSDAGGAFNVSLWGGAPGDTAAFANSLQTFGGLLLFNNASFDRARSASAANLAAQSGLGGQMVAPPGYWTASSNPAAGTAASASRAAGGAGVRHIGTGAIIVLSATTALAAITTVTFNFRDGASGAGTILFSVQVTLPAATVPVTAIPVPPLSLPGTAATAMTLEGSAAVGNLMESCSLFGYDAS